MTKTLLFFWHRYTAQSGRFLLHFCKGFFRAMFITTIAHPFDENKAREKDGYPFNELVTASGAQWFRNAQGNWGLFKANRIENCIPVRELFEYFNLPCRVGHAISQEQVCLVGLFATLHECGLSIDVEYIRKTYNGKSSNPCKGCGLPLATHTECRESKNASKNGNDPDSPFTSFDPPIYNCWHFHKDNTSR